MNHAHLLHKGVKLGFQSVERFAPMIAQRLIARTFFRPLRFKRPEREQLWLETAQRRQFPFAGYYDRRPEQSHFYVYEWGSGPIVLLVHGWAGRGSQLGALALTFSEAGYRAITFDAPAHGDSPGKQTNLLEFGDIIASLSEHYSGFEAIIGHSFGGVAAAFAISEGVQTNKLITIGSPAKMDYILGQFANQLGVSVSATAALARQIETLGQRPINTFSLAHLISQIDIPGLIIHDHQDREVAYEQALTLKDSWPQANFVSTNGLGHHRILRDADVIKTVFRFAMSAETLSEPYDDLAQVNTPII